MRRDLFSLASSYFNPVGQRPVIYVSSVNTPNPASFCGGLAGVLKLVNTFAKQYFVPAVEDVFGDCFYEHVKRVL